MNDATVAALKVPHSSTSVIFVTKITLSILTHANGKFAQVQDTTGTPVVIAKHIDATAAAGVPSVVTWDFGSQGTDGDPKGGVQIATGKTLNAVSEASGPAGLVYAEGYEITPPPTSN